MSGRRRLDLLLVERGLADSRSRAQALIREGRVLYAGAAVHKPGQLLASDASLEIAPGTDYVSRGGHKLAHALDCFGIDPAGQVCLDLGASTGGFTDVLLRRGVARVFAVDAGHGQLDPRIAADPRVVSLERLNVRVLDRAHIPDAPGMVVCDVSFIGLELALPAALALAAPDAYLVALIKPQFEVGRLRVGKGGIIRDPALHHEVCQRIRHWLEGRGWHVIGLEPSPLPGGDGNREFLIGAKQHP